MWNHKFARRKYNITIFTTNTIHMAKSDECLRRPSGRRLYELDISKYIKDSGPKRHMYPPAPCGPPGCEGYVCKFTSFKHGFVLGCLLACCLLVWLLYISIDWLWYPTGLTVLPSTLCVASALGSLQNPLKMNLQNRRPKGVQDDSQGSQNHYKFIKNRAQGPPDPIFDVILSIFTVQRI